MTKRTNPYDLHHSSFISDMHCDTLFWDRNTGYDITKRHKGSKRLFSFPGNHVDVPRLKDGNVSLQAFGTLTNFWNHNMLDKAKKTVDRFHEIVHSCNDLEWALHKEKALWCHENKRVGTYLAMQGAHPLEKNLNNLDWFYQSGVRMMTLTHFNNGPAAFGSVKKEVRNNPLPGFGKDLISAMNEKGMIVDVAHVNYQGVLDAAQYSNAPIVASHTAVKGVYDSFRGITDEEVEAIADTNGVVGIIFQPKFLNGSLYGSVSDLVDHIDHVKNLVGVDHVGLGSDFDGWIALPHQMRGVDDLAYITIEMYARGYSDAETKKVLGGNVLRVYDQVVG